MTRRDEALEAAARRLDPDAWDDLRPPGRMLSITYAETRTLSEIWADRRNHARKEAAAILDAALAVLHPTIPNTLEDLDALPVGTVVSNNRGTVAQLVRLNVWHLTDEDDPCATDELVEWLPWRPTQAWTVLWWGDNNETDKE